METKDVRALVDYLASQNISFWLAGGWGVDALVGRHTRVHQDLDVAIDKRQFDRLVAGLSALGWRQTIDWYPVRVEMTSADGLRVDIHPLEIAEDGSGRQAGLGGIWYDYPAHQFTEGQIGGQTVPCLDRDLQLLFHTGYTPREIDLQDIAQLQALDSSITAPQ